MNVPIVMPQLGLTMTEGAVSEWLKKPGERVRKNEALFSVSTDKVEMEVESMAEGTLREIIVSPGETVPVGTVLAHLDTDADDMEIAEGEQALNEISPEAAPLQSSIPQAEAPARDSARAPDKSIGQRPVSPRAKRLAAELGIDLGRLRGSGDNGQVVEEDVRRATSPDRQSLKPNTRRRQLIAERLTRSIQTIPAFSVSSEANAESLLALRADLQPKVGGNGIKLTITDLLLTIFASVLKISPDITSAWENNASSPQSSIDIGLAVATGEGIVAPIIRNVDELSLQDLLAERHGLVEKGRQGKLALSELEGGVSTLSNLGMYRVDQFQAIISPGQSSILAVGSIRNRPWVDGTALSVKPTMILNLTVDHRVADGAAAATFLNKLVELIEDPSGQVWRPGKSIAMARNGT